MRKLDKNLCCYPYLFFHYYFTRTFLIVAWHRVALLPLPILVIDTILVEKSNQYMNEDNGSKQKQTYIYAC